MIKHYEKFRLIDENGQNELLIEVNWNPKDEKTNDCKLLKLTYPDGKQAFVKKEYLNSLLFVIGTAKDQQKMIPQKITTVRKYTTVLGITAQKDIKKGEEIKCAVEINLPGVVDEIISQAKGEKKNKSGLILPAKVGNQ